MTADTPLSDAADELLATRLAAGLRYADAARACSVSEATVNRRMADPAFRGRVEAIRRAVAAQVLGRLVDRLDDAVESLHLIATGSEDDRARIAAADRLLAQHLHYHEQFDIVERLRRLEEEVEAKQAATGGRPHD